ncbi:MAG: TIGR04141 family sporadically distributed protein [Cellvibrionaceae bacterium]|nr:TIGR04141 family sporadically distributed protein [Cellvibrionaceae bacterium]
MAREKQYTYNIRLLRTNRSLESAFGPSFKLGGETALEERPWNSVEGARLFVGQIYSNEPPWADFLREQSSDLPENLFASGAGAVLFVPIDGYIFAVCFGHAHVALNNDAFVRQFGLKVTLNSVPRSGLRSLDTATPDAVTMQKRIQASRDSDLQQFGVDMVRDLARVAAGTPSDKSIAQFLAGKDSLRLTTHYKSDELGALCTQLLKAFNSEEYKTDFSWIDQMRLVSEKDVIAELDTLLFSSLQDLIAGNHADLHMSPPEIVDYTEGMALHYNGFGSHGVNYYSLSIEDYVFELSRVGFAGDIEELKQKHAIRAKRDDDDKFSQGWRVYDCFVYEASREEHGQNVHYVLFSGDWYRVEDNFKADIENTFEQIEKVALIGATSCRNERELIVDIDANRDDLLKLDQEKINPLGVKYANIEPCDFFSDKGEFIHLKDGHSSHSISHLWAQGIVSAEAFVSDKDFRKKLRKIVKERRNSKKKATNFEAILPLASQKPIRENFKVVFGIMRKPYRDGSLGIPFFSKVSLRTTAQRLEEFGIPYALELIQKPASDAKAPEDDTEEHQEVVEE